MFDRLNSRIFRHSLDVSELVEGAFLNYSYDELGWYLLRAVLETDITLGVNRKDRFRV
jgi:hypothetical protein